MKDTAKKPILVIMAAGMGSRFSRTRSAGCFLFRFAEALGYGARRHPKKFRERGTEGARA